MTQVASKKLQTTPGLGDNIEKFKLLYIDPEGNRNRDFGDGEITIKTYTSKTDTMSF